MTLREIIHLFNSVQPVRLMIREGKCDFYTDTRSANQLYSDLGKLGERDVDDITATGYITIELH